jgi:hypothetical protein
MNKNTPWRIYVDIDESGQPAKASAKVSGGANRLTYILSPHHTPERLSKAFDGASDEVRAVAVEHMRSQAVDCAHGNLRLLAPFYAKAADLIEKEVRDGK